MLEDKDTDVSEAGQALRQKLADDPGAFALVVAGPSGVGKTSVCEAVLDAEPQVRRCITTTTRSPRSDEVDGVSRHFVSVDAFQAKDKRGGFVESAEVHGHLYGATFDAVADALSGGQVMLMDVDVQGVATWKEVLADYCVTVFIIPPSLDVLAQRLESRQSEGESTFNLRMDNAISELSQAHLADYVVVNDILEDSIADLRAIIRAVHMQMQLQALEWDP